MSNHDFNAGVLGFNLKKWREKNLTREAVYWMRMNKINRKNLWKLGTQPILYLLCGEDWKALDSHWNVDRLGTRGNPVSMKAISNAYILHWNGPRM